MIKDKLLTTAMASKILGFTPNYIRRLIAEKKIKAIRYGHDWIMTESDIKHIKRQRTKKENGSENC